MKESAVECYSAIKTKKAFLIGERQVIQPHSTYIFATKTLDKLLKNVEFSENTQLDMDFIKKNHKKFRPERAHLYKDIMVFRSGGIGDLVFSYPVLAKIKQMNKSCKIKYVTQLSNRDILSCFEGNLIEDIIALPLLGQHFKRADAHIVFEGLIESNPQAECLDAYDLFYQHAFHESRFDDSLLPRFLFDEQIHQEMTSMLPRGLVLIHARSSSPFRNVQRDIWIELVRGLLAEGHPVGFIDSASSAAALDAFIATHFGQDASRVHNLAPLAGTIRHTLEICRASALVIGVDSSVINLAAALGKPSMGLYTCFPGELRLSHFPGARIIQSTYNGCGVAPCFHHVDGPKCVDVRNGKVAGCLAGFDAAEILSQARALLP